jgi:hypothetical protein
MNKTYALAITAMVLLASAGTTLAAPRLVAVTGTTIYDINPGTGVFTQGVAITGGTSTIGDVAFDCTTGRAWVASTGNDNLYTLDLSTGVATLVGNFGNSAIVMHGLHFDVTTGTLYGASSHNSGLYTINTTTGVATLIGSTGAGASSFFNIAVNTRQDVMYGVSTGNDALFTIDRGTGAGTLVGFLQGPSPSPNPAPQGLTYNKDTGAMYMIDNAVNSSEGLYWVDTNTGQSFKLATSPPSGNFLGLAYIPDTCGEPTVPTGAGYTTPSSQLPGQPITVVAQVLPVAGATPSTGVQVVADFSPIGGSAAQIMTPGANNTFSWTLNISVSAEPGTFEIPLTISDAQARVGTGAVGVRVRPGMPAGFIAEVEPNETKATATVGTITTGQGLFGYTEGSSTTTPGIASADTFRVTIANMPPAIYRHRLVLTTDPLSVGHTGTIRGLSQSASTGINATSDAAVQTSASTTTPARFNQWYGFGKGEEFYYRVVGNSTSTFSEYFATLETQTITPIVVPTVFAPGVIGILRPLDPTGNVGILVYDENFDQVADFAYAGGEGLLRDFAAGTYYVAISNTTTTDSRATPFDSAIRTGSVPDFAGLVVNNSTTAVPTLSRVFGDLVQTDVVSTPKNGAFDVAWVKFIVAAAAAPRCNAADIAYDDGTPLPPIGVSGGVNNGVTEGDYNLFFANFFDALSVCDIANDDGSPLPPFGALAVNNGVTEADYNLFFSIFFDGCSF